MFNSEKIKNFIFETLRKIIQNHTFDAFVGASKSSFNSDQVIKNRL